MMFIRIHAPPRLPNSHHSEEKTNQKGDKNAQFRAIKMFSASITYQFRYVVVGKNELCETGQSLFKSFPNPTTEEQKHKDFTFGWKLTMMNVYREK